MENTVTGEEREQLEMHTSQFKDSPAWRRRSRRFPSEDGADCRTRGCLASTAPRPEPCRSRDRFCKKVGYSWYFSGTRLLVSTSFLKLWCKIPPSQCQISSWRVLQSLFTGSPSLIDLPERLGFLSQVLESESRTWQLHRPCSRKRRWYTTALRFWTPSAGSEAVPSSGTSESRWDRRRRREGRQRWGEGRLPTQWSHSRSSSLSASEHLWIRYLNKKSW